MAWTLKEPVWRPSCDVFVWGVVVDAPGGVAVCGQLTHTRAPHGVGEGVLRRCKARMRWVTVRGVCMGDGRWCLGVCCGVIEGSVGACCVAAIVL